MKSTLVDSQEPGMTPSVALHNVVPTRATRIRSEDEPGSTVSFLILMHLWPILGLVTGLVLPLMLAIPIVWACRKGRSALMDDQGREIMNTILTLLVLVVIPIIGWMALVIWLPVWLVSCVRGAAAVGNREYFRYPMTFRFIS